jgi:hypothetical protein
MFEKGVLIKCVCLNFQSGDSLTVDKWYVSLGSSSSKRTSFTIVKDDTGIEVAYPSRLFISLTEERKRKIKKIYTKTI